MFSIENLKSTIQQTGLSRGNRYSLELSIPSILTGPASEIDLRNIHLRISTIELPGKQVATSEVKHYGPVTKRPYATIYEDLTFEIMCSSNLIERRFFSEWMDRAYDPHVAKIGYYDQIKSVVKFKSYGEHSENNLYSVTFQDCYPISIGALNFAYANEDILTMQVTMAYKKWGDEENKTLDGVNATQAFDLERKQIIESRGLQLQALAASAGGYENLNLQNFDDSVQNVIQREIANNQIMRTLSANARTLQNNLSNAQNNVNRASGLFRGFRGF